MNSFNRCHVGFCAVMLACALRPWLEAEAPPVSKASAALEQDWAFARWHSGNAALVPLPLSAVEQRFASGFPGQIAKFSDGASAWVVRHVNRPTRQLHPAADCYRGLGLQVGKPQVLAQSDHTRWQCFIVGQGQQWQVCERIFDRHQGQWTDASAWYWENLLQPDGHEWWAVTRITLVDIYNLYIIFIDDANVRLG